jgi:hypothetical protein
MPFGSTFNRYRPTCLAGALLLGLFVGAQIPNSAVAEDYNPQDLAIFDRLTWGLNTSSVEHFRQVGFERWLQEQLHPPATTALPDTVNAQIEAMADVRKLPFDIAVAFDAQAKSANQVADPDQKKRRSRSIRRR